MQAARQAQLRAPATSTRCDDTSTRHLPKVLESMGKGAREARTVPLAVWTSELGASKVRPLWVYRRGRAQSHTRRVAQGRQWPPRTAYVLYAETAVIPAAFRRLVSSLAWGTRRFAVSRLWSCALFHREARQAGAAEGIRVLVIRPGDR